MALTAARARTLPRVTDLAALARPGVLVLVVLTAPPGFTLGRERLPPLGLMLLTVLATALLAAGCSALNAWLEVDRDRQMARTRDRPLPAGRVSEGTAVAFGAGTIVLGMALLATTTPLAAAIGALTCFWYVAVYTIWLKPRSPQSIVIGGLAGATPPIIADAAATGTLGWCSVAVTALVFLWTPVHFWAIALFRSRDYERAGFPMMPAAVGAQPTRWRMLGYALATVAVSLLPSAWGLARPACGLVALVSGLGLIGAVVRSLVVRHARADRRVFIASVIYLAVVASALTLA